MLKFKSHYESAEIQYHIDHGITLGELFRVGSSKYYSLFNEVRYLHNEGKIALTGTDKHLIENTDIGEFAEYKGNKVPLDSPMMEAESDGKDVELNKPKAGGPKKYYVYVKDPSSGNVKKVSWGDTTGLKMKLNDPEARKSFAARHDCANKKDRTKPGYWACNMPRYAKQLGLSGGGNFFW
jgi:hypothetical protein